MALFDDASLVVTPNGYKEGTLYSIKPTSGLGDMTVVRATTATRVNSAGLIELVPYNLLTYSEQFDNAAWTKLNGTVSANQAEAPDGTISADLFYPTTSGTDRLLAQTKTGTIGQTFTSSAFVKSSGVDWVLFYAANLGGCWFNASTGVFGTVGSGVTASVLGQVNGFWRISLTATIANTNVYFYIGTANANGTSTITKNGTDGILVWGAQLVTGALPKDYLRTETRLNIPRLDYSNGSCPSLLVEPQRTNLLTYSEQFDNAAWTKTNATVTPNTTISPDGTQNADTLIENTANATHLMTQAAGGGGIQTYSISVFAKSFSADRYLQIWVGNTINAAAWIRVDLDNGTITQNNGIAGTGYSIASSSIQDFGNGWYKCVLVANKLNTTGTNTIQFRLSQISTGGESNTYTGNGTSGLYLWGAQVEVGSYATSYIPTTTAAVTRNADQISKTGISSLINSVEGVLYAEISAVTNDGTFKVISISDSSTSNVVRFYKTITDNQMSIRVTVAGVHQFNVLYTSPDLTTNNKMALKYKANDFAFWVNGVEVATDTSGTTFTAGTLTELAFDDGSGAAPFYGKCQNLIVFPSALSDTELAQLTTL